MDGVQTMRLIDADKFTLALMDASLSSVDEDTILDLVDAVDTVDAVPVVRCKDCEHLYGSICAICGATGLQCCKCNPGGCNCREDHHD